MNGRSSLAWLGVVALGISACVANPWTASAPSDPPAVSPLPNGVVVSLGEASFNVASTLLEEAMASRWPEGLALKNASGLALVEYEPGTDVPVWADAHVVVHELSLSGSAVGLELTLDLSLQPMTLYGADDPDELCPRHVAFEHGSWTVPLRLTRSKLGEVQATAESAGEMAAQWMVSDADPCGQEDGGEANAPGAGELPVELAAALVMELSPWLSDALPAALGLNLATTAALTDGSSESATLVFDLRTSLSDDATWWHWSQSQLVVGFDTRISATADPCVPDVETNPITATAIPATDAARVWLVHTGTIKGALAGLWRSGRFCADRPASITWAAQDWINEWEALDRLDDQARILARVWPREAPEALFEPTETGAEMTLTTGAWTLELYGPYQDADVRLATLEIDVQVRGDLAVGPERGVWIEVGEVALNAFSAQDGLIAAPSEATVLALLSGWIETLAASTPMTWLPPTPQLAEVSVSVDGDYLLFAATH
jgi:hypothetical protein